MKKKLTKAQYDALSEELKKCYKQDGDNYILQVEEDDNDTGPLSRALDRVKEELKTAKQELAAAQAKLNDAATIDARKKGDIATLEASWNAKHEQIKTDAAAKITKLESQVNKLLVGNVAQSLASELCGDNAHLIVRDIQDRLAVEYEGDAAKTRVLDAAGKPSALTVDELKKEFVANGKYKSIIIASKASGSADTSGSKNNQAAVLNGKKFNELTEKERVEFYKRDPEAFKAAVAANAK